MYEDGREQAVEMLKAAGVQEVRKTGETPSVPGHCIHEIGTARMGTDAKTSVLNKYTRLGMCRMCSVPMARPGFRAGARILR